MDKFWPSSSPDSARNCLNVALYGLRQLFHKIDLIHDYIVFKDECYFINPEVEIWLDVEEFLKYWRMARSIEREKGIEASIGEYEFAASLYKGDFMEEDLYESWPSLERENLKEIYLVVLDRLSRHYSLDGKTETAIDLCELTLGKDNCREDVHRRLMECYYRTGQRDKALKQFRKCAEILREELEVEPTRKTRELYEQMKQDWLVPEKKGIGEFK
jgi:DNA-binding SARP family transcriptional activator